MNRGSGGPTQGASILWFRRDLRTGDNPLLSIDGPVLPIFIFDTVILERLERNDRRVSWLFNQVVQFKNALKQSGLDLALFHGTPKAVLAYLRSLGFASLRAGGDYEHYARRRDHAAAGMLDFDFIFDTYLFSPDEVLKKDGTPYLVFTPFYKTAKALLADKPLSGYPKRHPVPVAFDYAHIVRIGRAQIERLPIAPASIGFEPESYPLALDYPPETLLARFKTKIGAYALRRDFLDEPATSGLSVALRFGTIGIRELFRRLQAWKQEGLETEPFMRQLIFREFYAALLYHFPSLERESYKKLFDPVEDEAKFASFTQARTGVPIVDAAVTQLLKTGTMPNRARMVAASFFCKNLLLPWQWGERFFARHLMDYDAANNVLGWQWSAGTGIDPQPFFRIFNPWLQAKKFDPQSRYVKTWLPALHPVNAHVLHDEALLFNIDIPNYPKPMLRHKEAAQKALARYRRRS